MSDENNDANNIHKYNRTIIPKYLLMFICFEYNNVRMKAQGNTTYRAIALRLSYINTDAEKYSIRRIANTSIFLNVLIFNTCL